MDWTYWSGNLNNTDCVMPDLIGHRVQKHSETVRDTYKFRGTADSFPIISFLEF